VQFTFWLAVGNVLTGDALLRITAD